MPTKDTTEIKEKILNVIRNKGPSLPARISKEIEQSPLFTSAFLSELISEHKIKTSNLRVGGSPLYLMRGQEEQLEKYSGHLKPKEKEALDLLRERKFLKDSEQEPAIRVALREIKDFAIPFSRNNETIWRHLSVKEEDFDQKENKEDSETLEKEESSKIQEQSQEEKDEEKKEETISNTQEENQEKEESSKIQEQSQEEKDEEKSKDLHPELKEKPNEEEKRENTNTDNKDETPKEQKKGQLNEKVKKPKSAKSSHKSSKRNERFFNKVKEFLSEQGLEISDIEGFTNNDLILKINNQGKEELLIAYNKKRIDEKDILKASKRAKEEGIPYRVISLGEPLKRLENLIEAIRELSDIQKIE